MNSGSELHVITVFADVLCPFTHAGLCGLVNERADRHVRDVRIDIRMWPLELINGAPLDAHHVAAEIDALRADVVPDLFAGFDVDAFPTSTIPAFSLATAAAATGDVAVVETVGLALRHALFEQGLDIGDPQVVAGIATRFGLTPADAATTDAAMRADWDAGKARGVVGSPHFFTDDGNDWFCPGFDIHRDDTGRFHIKWKETVGAFVESVFQNS